MPVFRPDLVVIPDNLNTVIEDWCKETRTTLVDLSKSAGLNPHTLYLIRARSKINPTTRVKHHTIEKLARAMGVDVSTLTNGGAQ